MDRSHLKRAAIAALLLVMLCACGQRGPLYLPDETAAPQSEETDEDQ